MVFEVQCLHSKSLEDYTFVVEALVAGSKDDEKKLIGPRLVRRWNSWCVGQARINCTCQTSKNLTDTN